MKFKARYYTRSRSCPTQLTLYLRVNLTNLLARISLTSHSLTPCIASPDGLGGS
jgi:hypothetical protein